MLGLYTDHDANAAITVGGEVVAVLELERLVNKRYHNPAPGREPNSEGFQDTWSRAVRVVANEANVSHVDTAVVVTWVSTSALMHSVVPGLDQENEMALAVEALLRRSVESVVTVGRWESVPHHLSHASSGFYASPFRHALVVSYDAAGNDGVFNVYDALRERPRGGGENLNGGIGVDPGGGSNVSDIELVNVLPLRLGSMYNILGRLLPEVTSNTRDPRVLCEDSMIPGSSLPDQSGCVHVGEVSEEEAARLRSRHCEHAGQDRAAKSRCVLSVAGKLMGYAGTAEPVGSHMADAYAMLRQRIGGTDPYDGPGASAYSYVGCFNDRKDGEHSLRRDLPVENHDLAETASPNTCALLCVAQSYPYFAVQNGSRCFCGSSYGRYGEAKCDVPCGDGGGDVCGGARANSVYKIHPPGVNPDDIAVYVASVGPTRDGPIGTMISFWDGMYAPTTTSTSAPEKGETDEGAIPPGFERQRLFAATVQAAFQKMVTGKIVAQLLPQAQERARVRGEESIDGIVLVGGCALNVPTNWKIAETVAINWEVGEPKGQQEQQRPTNIGVYTPPAPNDGGLGLGAAWLVSPPRFPEKTRTCGTRSKALLGVGEHELGDDRWRIANSLQYTGPYLWDLPDLAAHIRNRGAVRVTARDVAARLLDGAIIGLVRGRAEFGPRALGHRSLLACATDRGMLIRLNNLKRRQWYRPVAPMIAREDAHACFGDLWAAVNNATGDYLVDSPYMNFAAPLTEWCAKRLPAIAHFDGTARPQTVTATQEPWVHALLAHIRNGTPDKKAGVLINTSLNIRGRPILNTLAELFELLDDEANFDLDAVVVDDWLFERPANVRRRQLDSEPDVTSPSAAGFITADFLKT